jgi:antitoxin component of MazEF toxin-antitoxin module
MTKKAPAKAKATKVISVESRRYDLQQLGDRITPKNSHRLVDWGKPVGKETR